jgi:hypothetical protein
MPAQGVIVMAGTLRVRRSRGALSGALLVLLGIWGALIPFVGPYFHYAYTPDRAFDPTAGRLWLEVLPGVVTLIGGIVVFVSRFRPAAVFAAWLATLAGAWFAVGHLIGAALTGIPKVGAPVGSATRAAMEQLGFFTGLGVVILFVAALVLGRFTVVGAADKSAGMRRAAADRADASGETTTREPVPAGSAAATPASRRVSVRATSLVPVFRGRQRSAATSAAASRAAAEEDVAAGQVG